MTNLEKLAAILPAINLLRARLYPYLRTPPLAMPTEEISSAQLLKILEQNTHEGLYYGYGPYDPDEELRDQAFIVSTALKDFAAGRLKPGELAEARHTLNAAAARRHIDLAKELT